MKFTYQKSKRKGSLFNYDKRVLDATKLLEHNPDFEKEIIKIRKRLKIPIKGFNKEKVDKLYYDWSETGELLRISMRKNEKSIGQNRRKLTLRLPNCILPTRNTI